MEIQINHHKIISFKCLIKVSNYENLPYTFLYIIRNISVPFLNEREVEIAYEVLRVDKEPPRSQVTKSLTKDKNILNVVFCAPSTQQLRVGVNGFLDHVMLLVETLENFGPPLSSAYSYS